MPLTIVDDHQETLKALYKGPQMDERHREVLGIIMSDYEYCLQEVRDKTILWDALEAAYRKQVRTEDSTRSSERSNFMSHVTQSVVDDNVSELTDAAFGTGRFFDCIDNVADENKIDVDQMAILLDEKIRGGMCQEGIERTLFLGELFGSGITELVPSRYIKRTPTTQPDGTFGVVEEPAYEVITKAWHPKFFRFSPGATSLHECTWMGIETPMPASLYNARVKAGQYADAYPQGIGSYIPDQSTRPDIFKYQHVPNQWLMLRWYGMLPERLVDSKSKSDKLVPAYVVVANREAVLYCGPNPFMMQDIPFYLYRPTIVPGTMWGLGSAEKVFHLQRAADRHFRTHEDSLALTAYPVTGMDSTRMPKGLNLKIKPGTNIMMPGKPSDIMERLDFGQPQQMSLDTAQRAIDWAKDTGGVAGISSMLAAAADAKAGSMALAMGPIIKKIKGRLRNLTSNYLIPVIKGMAYRYMQYMPEQFPAADVDFKVVGVLGMAEREFEQGRWMNFANTLGPDSPIASLISSAMMRQGNLQGRETLAAKMEEFAQEQMVQKTQDTTSEVKRQIELRALAAGAAKDEADALRMTGLAKKAVAEAEATPMLIQADILKSMVTNSSAQVPDNLEFQNRYQAMQLVLKEMELGEKAKDRESNERIAEKQMAKSAAIDSDKVFSDAMSKLLNNKDQ